MTTFQYTDLVHRPFGLGEFYSMAPSFELKQHSRSSATFVDTGTGCAMELDGSRLAFKGEKMTAGRIEEIRFVDDHGRAFLVATDGHYSAAKLSKHMLEDVSKLFQQLFAGEDTILGNASANYLIGASGDDVIKGRGGADEIFAVGGRDIITGGGGSDLFYFSSVSDIDIITDFHSVGGANRHDYIGTPLSVLDIRQAGDHTIVEFADGKMIKLLDVDATTVTEADDFLM